MGLPVFPRPRKKPDEPTRTVRKQDWTIEEIERELNELPVLAGDDECRDRRMRRHVSGGTPVRK